jgi:hypothetical protein
MHWHHPAHPGRRVRLAYCQNLHAAEDLAGTLAGLREVTVPLRARLARDGEPFGVGLYLEAALAARLASDAGRTEQRELEAFLREHALEPFTFNAFPYGGFQRDGLKQRVFAPSWLEPERLAFTRSVATVAVTLARALGTSSAGGHVSISTHPGGFGASLGGEEDRIAIARNLARAVAFLARLEQESGARVVLSLEAEPRASCNDTAMLAAFLGRVRQWGVATLASEHGCGDDAAIALLDRHLGACLDTCHSAIEFEEPARALAAVLDHGTIGKLQYSSALALSRPAEHAEGRTQLFALNEPRFLHQVTGLGPAGRCEVDDLGELAAVLGEGAAGASKRAAGGDRAARAQWLAADEWRCHFHVPVDLERLPGSELRTTRAHAASVLAAALAEPERWGSDELHLEIETYTWQVLSAPARGEGSLVDGLEREYRHVFGELERAGWTSAARRDAKPAARG